jgi:SAM-dependent methyltransferase
MQTLPTHLHPQRNDRRARRFARFWTSVDASIDEAIRPAKEALFVGLPNRVVEIGPGLGSTFAYLEPGTAVTAFEPNPHFHDALRDHASQHHLELDLRGSAMEDARLPDDSEDLVISTLVLCSVDDPAATIDEIWRVLRPGGRLVFIEHVIAPPRSLRRLVQRVIRRPWRAFCDGCDPCAITHDHLAASRFHLDQTHLEPFGSRLDPTNLVFWGTAAKQP